MEACPDVPLELVPVQHLLLNLVPQLLRVLAEATQNLPRLLFVRVQQRLERVELVADQRRARARTRLRDARLRASEARKARGTKLSGCALRFQSTRSQSASQCSLLIHVRGAAGDTGSEDDR